MLRKILELDLGPMTDSEFREVLELATSDIKSNRVDFGKRTSLLEVVEIAGICFRAYKRGKAKHKATDRVPWFVDAKELHGSIFLHAFAVGVITAIIDDPYHSAEETVQEIRGTLSDLKKVWSDGSISDSDGYRQEKALRANGEPREKKSLKLYHGSSKSSCSILKKGKDCGGRCYLKLTFEEFYEDEEYWEDEFD